MYCFIVNAICHNDPTTLPTAYVGVAIPGFRSTTRGDRSKCSLAFEVYILKVFTGIRIYTAEKQKPQRKGQRRCFHCNAPGENIWT